MSLQVQFATFAWMIASGLALGVCFDTIGVVSREYKVHRVLQALLDIVYWGAATVFVFRVLLHANYGEVRAFVFIGLAIGALVYYWLFGPWIRYLVSGMVRLLNRLLRFITRVIRVVLVTPLMFIWRLIIRLVLAAGGFVAMVSIFLTKIVVQWSQHVWKRIRGQ